MSETAQFVWGIYHRDAEYARLNGDPIIGTVMAKTKEEAEQAASEGKWLTFNNIKTHHAGFWAWKENK